MLNILKVPLKIFIFFKEFSIRLIFCYLWLIIFYYIILLILYLIKYLWEWKTVWYIYSLIISWCLFGLRINVQHQTQIKYIKLIHICSVIEFIAIIYSLILSRNKRKHWKILISTKNPSPNLYQTSGMFSIHETFLSVFFF